MEAWLLILVLFCITGLNAAADCVSGELPSVETISTYNIGRWVVNHKQPSSCPGQLTQYEIYHYDNDGGDVYLALLTPLLGNNQYALVDGSLKQVSVASGGNSGSMKTIPMDQFVYAPNGSAVGAYIPSSSHVQVVGYRLGNSDYGLCGYEDGNAATTTFTCSTTLQYIDIARLHVKGAIETIDCGSLGSIPNGYVSLLDGSTLYGSVAVYQCNVTGYILTGNEKRFCSQNATWNGTEPVCELFNCTVPSIVNGIIQGDSFSYGSSISYSCNEGYYLTGDSVITCGINMTWNISQTPAVCNPVNCGDPGIPGNGSRIIEDGFKYQSVVFFNCTTGFNLMGSSSIECLSNGTWNSSLPVCEPVNCGDPGTPNNGLKNITTYTYGTMIDFTCQSGYMLSTGYSPITCQADGSWSGATPDCIPVQCNDNPPTLVNGTFNHTSDNKYTFMTSVVYVCDDGFTLNGTSTITCLANRQWSGGAPVCLRVCNNFNFTNGVIDQSLAPFTVGVVVQVSCVNGYQLNTSESVIQCLSTGEWNYTSTPECIEDAAISTRSSSTSVLSSTTTTTSTSQSSSTTSSSSLSVISTSNKQSETSTTSQVSQSSSSSIKVTTSSSDSTSTLTTSLSMASAMTSSMVTSSKPNDQKSTSKTSNLQPTPTTSTSSTPVNIMPSSHSTPASNSPTTVPGSSSSPTGLYSGIAAGAFLVLLVIALVIIFIALVLVKRKSGREKKYTVSTRENHVNPIVISELYGQTGTTSSVRYTSTEEKFELPEASTYEDPVSTLQRNTECPSVDYSSITIEEHLGEFEPSTEGLAYEDPVSTLKNSRAGRVHINKQQNSVSYRPPPSQQSNTEGHMNQLYMDVEEDEITKKDLTVEEVVYASNDDEITVPNVMLPLPLPLEDGDNVEPGPWNSSIYASNDDPPVTEESYLQFSEGTIKNSAPAYNEPQTYMDFSEGTVTDKTAPVVRDLGSMKQRREKVALSTVATTDSMNDTFTNPRTFTISDKRTTAIYEAPASQVVELMAQLKRRNVKFIPKKQLTTTDILGSGFYGKVYKATYAHKGNSVVDVAVKTLQGEEISEKERANFLKEAVIMSQFKHTNVLKMHGMVMESSKDCMIVTEIMDKGDLKQLLGKLRPDPGELRGNEELSHLLLNFSRQVCMGLTYLSEKGFIHRDIAARNVLVNAKNVCKIADFGLSRDLEEDSYYMANKEAKVPIKWTAPEALHYRKYSTASDVWSYGCLLYEIWSLGLSPFTGVTNMESLRRVERGYRLPPPPGCPRPIYEIMIKCWHPEAKQRQRFNDIMLGLLQQDSVILLIPEEELSMADSQAAGVIGANLKAGEKLYNNLQQIYAK